MKRNFVTYGLYPAPPTATARVARDWLGMLFLCLIFVTPLWPEFAELKMAGIPNMAPPRLIRAALIFATLFLFFRDRERAETFVRRLRENWIVITLFVLLFALRFASAFLGHNPALQVFAFIKSDFWTYLTIFFITLFVVRDERDIKRLVEVVVLAAAIVGLAALVEYYLKRNLFARFFTVTSDYLMVVLGDKTRDNIYRAQGTMEHPLLMGQFFAMVLPWCWYCFRYSERMVFRLIACGSGLLGVAAIYFSGSRSSFAVAIPLVALMFIWELWRWTKRSSNRPAQYLMLLQFPLLLTAFAGVLLYIKTLAAGTTQITRGSASVRMDMLNAGVPKVGDAVFMGHGLGEATNVVTFVGKGGIRTLDNYYLLVALESGMIVVLLTAFLWLYFLFAALAQSGKEDMRKARLSMLLGLAVLGYIIIMSIHSLQSLTWLLFVIFACILILREKKPA